jgi:hypothetical protein
MGKPRWRYDTDIIHRVRENDKKVKEGYLKDFERKLDQESVI